MLHDKPAKSLLVSIIALSALSACTITPTPTNDTALTTVSQIRLDDYLGKWYEIGRLPMSFQDKCTHNVTATYSLEDNGKINVLNACVTKDGMTSVNGEAYATDETNTKLRVSFLPSFLKSYQSAKPIIGCWQATKTRAHAIHPP